MSGNAVRSSVKKAFVSLGTHVLARSRVVIMAVWGDDLGEGVELATVDEFSELLGRLDAALAGHGVPWVRISRIGASQSKARKPAPCPVVARRPREAALGPGAGATRRAGPHVGTGCRRPRTHPRRHVAYSPIWRPRRLGARFRATCPGGGDPRPMPAGVHTGRSVRSCRQGRGWPSALPRAARHSHDTGRRLGHNRRRADLRDRFSARTGTGPSMPGQSE